jgi:methionyl-tRNA synthetase
MSDPFYITTAISYPNGKPHIGHAYELIATDAMARFQRLDGRDVFFLTGTDEHGQKMQQTARAEGISPEELAERNSNEFREMGKLLNSSNDDFIRTTEKRHHETVQEVWRRMEKNGDIYKGGYAGWYSVRDEAYYQEEETELRADGVRYGPQGTPVEWVEEESYFFKLSAYEDKLLQLYEDQPDFIGPNERRNEVISFVKSGLKDLSISRTTFDWGIKVPGDDKHVMYVWVDALTNYITATGYVEDENGPRAKYWPADVHIIGKDGSYSEEGIGTRINADLANGIGNLASRSLSMINKNCEGRVPTPGPLTPEDEAILKIADEAIDICREEMGKQQIHKAVAAIINIVNEADRYFAAQAPWVLKKTDEARMGTVLYVTADVVRQIAILFQPIMPETSAKILDLVAVAEENRVFAKLGAAGRLQPGTELPAPSPVYPRYVAPDAGKA